VRRLIVNADDFGYTAGVNRAILEAHTQGIVTSSTLMANGRSFADAVRLASAAPQLSIGCHIVLIDGEPLLAPDRIPTLASRGKSSRFRDGLMSFAALAISGMINADEVEAEAKEQICKIQSTGIAVSHFDTHKHTHIFPKVLRPLLRAAAACGVKAVRNPFGPRRPLLSNELLAKPGLWKRTVEVRMLRGFAAKFQAAVDRLGFSTPDGTLGIEVTGVLDERLFRAIAESIPEGTWEFVCHPGYNDAELQAANTRLRQSRELELKALTLPEARQLLAEKDIELISYREFVERRTVDPEIAAS
jgi:hopanoid biosynthesis associated protein HpnK